MKWPIISEDPHIQQHYERCRDEGTSHTLAEMFALAQPPMSDTDREFQEGRCNGNQFEKEPRVGDLYKKMAARAGVSTTGRYYHAGLAEYPGDPKAWISDRGDVRKRCEQEGWGCTGAVKVKGRQRRPAPEVDVAEDLVMERVADEMAKDPTQRVGDVREKVKNRLKPRKMPTRRKAS